VPGLALGGRRNGGRHLGFVFAPLRLVHVRGILLFKPKRKPKFMEVKIRAVDI
jgi:hypothetical protein